MLKRDRVSHLQDKIRQDCQTVINSCHLEDEIDFIFPEIIRIYYHDLAALDSWKHHVDWLNSLSPSERQVLTASETDRSEMVETNVPSAALAKPAEIIIYEDFKKKSHPHALRDRLRLLFASQLRQEYEAYISEQAIATGYKSLVPANLQQASNLTLANFYWYFQSKNGVI
jgi:predicted dinucleotide-binding enzyme